MTKGQRLLRLLGVIRGHHGGGFVAPTAVAQIENVVLLAPIVSIRQVDPSGLGKFWDFKRIPSSDTPAFPTFPDAVRAAGILRGHTPLPPE